MSPLVIVSGILCLTASALGQEGYDYAPPAPQDQLRPSRPGSPPRPAPQPRPETDSGLLSQGVQQGDGGHGHHGGSDDPLGWLRESVPGEPEVDYPIFNEAPITQFSCDGRADGMYADPEARCQAWHQCFGDRRWSFLCPNGTIFNQEVFTCVWWFDFDCNTAEDFYSRNDDLYKVEPQGEGGQLGQGNGGNQPTRGGNQPTRGGNQPTRGGNQPTRGGDQPTRGGNQPTRGGNQPTQGGNQPTRGGNQPTRGGNQPTRGENQPTRGGNQPTRGGNQPNYGGNKPTRGGNQPTRGGNQPTRGGNEPSRGGQGKYKGGSAPLPILPLVDEEDDYDDLAGYGNIPVSLVPTPAAPAAVRPDNLYGAPRTGRRNNRREGRRQG